jgi:hypothetical protein
VVCLIERHPGAGTQVEPIEPRLAAVALSKNREPGFDLYDDSGGAAEAVTAGGAYRLTVGHDLCQATAALRSIARHARPPCHPAPIPA